MKEIPGASRYMATEDGQIWDTKLQRFKVQTLNGIPQYYYTTIDWDDGTRKLVRVHRLVALAYWPNPDNLPMVDHKNQNPHDNHKDNLRWANRSTNNRNSTANVMVEYKGETRLLIDVAEEMGIPTAKGQSPQMRRMYQRIREGHSVERAASELRLRPVLPKGWNPCKVAQKYNKRKRGVHVPQRDGTTMWFPSYNYIEKDLHVHAESAKRKVALGWYLEDLKNRVVPHAPLVEIDGVLKTRAEWLQFYGKTESRTSSLQRKRGWTFEEALKAPLERAARK